MRKIIIYFTIYICSINYMLSVPCEGDCHENEWILTDSGYLIPFEDCPDCQIKIWYWYRDHICESIRYKEVQLSYLYVRPECYNCGYHTNDILRYSFRWMLLNAPWPRFCPPGDYNVKATHVSCWTRNENNYIVTCPQQSCCWQNYYICNGNIFLLSQSNYVVCEDYQGQSCIFLCDKLPTPIIQPISNSLKTYDKTNNKYNQKEESSIVLTNPSNSMIKIEFFSKLEGKFSLAIFNEFESKIKISELTANNINKYFEIDLRQFNSGMYFYRIYSSDIMISSGNFIVLK